jgi:tRNA threonylcarbamoyladenosine biosynthesis protein TsaB
VLVLAIDSCLAACQAAVVKDGVMLSRASEPMARGHQERLALMVEDVMAVASFIELDRVAVTVGPGSFTGLRVGLAFAKGLALALDRPCVGVGTLEALAAGISGRRAAVIDAGRGAIYLQMFADGAAIRDPEILPVESAAARLARAGVRAVIGPHAGDLAGLLGPVIATDLAAPTPENIARLAATASIAPPRPLYLRPPDAKAKAR